MFLFNPYRYVAATPLEDQELLLTRATSGTITAGAQSSTGYCAYQKSDSSITIQASTTGTYSWTTTTSLKIWPCVGAEDSTKSGTLNGRVIADSSSLAAIDVTECYALTRLQCSGNQLTSLDVSANTALGTLYCHGNHLTSLDVSANTALTSLSCTTNSSLTSLGTLLSTITLCKCYNCNLSELTFESSTAGPTTLSCYGNTNLTESLGALQSLFTSLPTVTGTHTIYIGTTVSDTTYDSIATGKGWTISRTTPA
jgi:hypothetical protein